MKRSTILTALVVIAGFVAGNLLAVTISNLGAVIAVQALVAIAVLVLARRLTARASRTIIEFQYDILTDAEINHDAKALGEEKQHAYIALINEVKAATGGVVRIGHTLWARDVLSGETKSRPIPMCLPIRTAPYRVQADFGVRAVAEYAEARVKGKPLLISARAIEAAALNQSPLAMVQYATMMIRGDVPGKEPEPLAGRLMLEQAVAMKKLSGAAATLGEMYLEGKLLPHQPLMGIALLKEAYGMGYDTLVMDIATWYLRGVGDLMQPDRKEARVWALRSAPRWRQRLAALGISQDEYCDAMLEFYETTCEKVAAMSDRHIREVRAGLKNQ